MNQLPDNSNENAISKPHSVAEQNAFGGDSQNNDVPEAGESAQNGKTSKSRKNKLIKIFGITLVLLIAVGFVLSSFLNPIANEKLRAALDSAGWKHDLQDVEISIWGAYETKGGSLSNADNSLNISFGRLQGKLSWSDYLSDGPISLGERMEIAGLEVSISPGDETNVSATDESDSDADSEIGDDNKLPLLGLPNLRLTDFRLNIQTEESSYQVMSKECDLEKGILDLNAFAKETHPEAVKSNDSNQQKDSQVIPIPGDLAFKFKNFNFIHKAGDNHIEALADIEKLEFKESHGVGKKKSLQLALVASVQITKVLFPAQDSKEKAEVFARNGVLKIALESGHLNWPFTALEDAESFFEWQQAEITGDFPVLDLRDTKVRKLVWNGKLEDKKMLFQLEGGQLNGGDISGTATLEGLQYSGHGNMKDVYSSEQLLEVLGHISPILSFFKAAPDTIECRLGGDVDFDGRIQEDILAGLNAKGDLLVSPGRFNVPKELAPLTQLIAKAKIGEVVEFKAMSQPFELRDSKILNKGFMFHSGNSSMLIEGFTTLAGELQHSIRLDKMFGKKYADKLKSKSASKRREFEALQRLLKDQKFEIVGAVSSPRLLMPKLLNNSDVFGNLLDMGKSAIDLDPKGTNSEDTKGEVDKLIKSGLDHFLKKKPKKKK